EHHMGKPVALHKLEKLPRIHHEAYSSGPEPRPLPDGTKAVERGVIPPGERRKGCAVRPQRDTVWSCPLLACLPGPEPPLPKLAQVLGCPGAEGRDGPAIRPGGEADGRRANPGREKPLL